MKNRNTITIFTTIVLVLACFGVLPPLQAVVPPPDGGYPGFNTAEGQKALFSLTTGVANTAVGWFSLKSETDGSFNTAVGAGTLVLNVGNQSANEGVQNTAIGAAALLLNTTGSGNTAVGSTALLNNTTATGNTAVGANALADNTTGADNTAVGSHALTSNTTGMFNTANGAFALVHDTTGGNNTATGCQALFQNTSGSTNTASGFNALVANTTGAGNTAIGAQALLNNTSGSFNVVLVGGQNLTTGDFNIDIGNDGVAGESNTIRIGNPLHSRAFIAGISGVTVSGGTAVFVKGDGQLGTSTSSARFKRDISSMDEMSNAILALRPVTFRYKPELDRDGIPQFGLLAEEVEKINPDLVVRDKEGKPYSVRYDQVNAMLLNEFLKEHRKVERLEATVADLAAELRQVRALVQTNSSILQVAASDP